MKLQLAEITPAMQAEDAHREAQERETGKEEGLREEEQAGGELRKTQQAIHFESSQPKESSHSKEVD